MELEERMAIDNNVQLQYRGPNPWNLACPKMWKGMTFNWSKDNWTRQSRESLPAEYLQIEDWHSDVGLEEEARLAYHYHIPWEFRGPPNGPIDGNKFWRGRAWRPSTGKWMNRGGENLEERKQMYGPGGKYQKKA